MFFPDLSQFTTGIEIVDVFIASLAYGFVLFPLHLFAFFIGNVVFWLGFHVIWAVIEWVYKKIPGVN
jgi:hypothetical protein